MAPLRSLNVSGRLPAIGNDIGSMRERQLATGRQVWQKQGQDRVDASP